MNSKEYSLEDLDFMVHDQLCNILEHLYWRWACRKISYDTLADQLASAHEEFIDDKDEAFWSSQDSLAAYEDFLEDFNQ